MRISAISVCIAAVVVSAASAPADELTATYEPPDYIRQPPVLPTTLRSRGVRRLGMEEAIRLAVANNLGIVLRREQLKVSKHNVDASRGEFEPTVSGSYSHAPQNPVTNAAESDAWSLNIGQNLPTGTRIGIDFSNSRTQGVAPSGEPTPAPLFTSSLGVNVSQSLLRGFSLDRKIPSAGILRARLSSQRARHDVRIAMSNTVKQTEDAYWDLVQALKYYQVQDDSLALARKQMDLTKRKIAAGLLAPADLISAEGPLAERELALVQAESAIDQASDQLRRALNLPRDQWQTALLPIDTPDFESVKVDLDQALEKAVAHRPEFRQREIDLQRADLDIRVAENARLPTLDANFFYGLRGGGPTNPVSSYGPALSQVFTADVPEWSVFLNFTWTPLNRAATARLESSRSSRRSAKIQMDQEMVELYHQLRGAIRDLDTADRQVHAAGKFRTLAERMVDVEQRKFLNNTSDNFLIAQRQAELSRAQQAELAAIVAHRKAKTRLELITGVILDKRDIELIVAPGR